MVGVRTMSALLAAWLGLLPAWTVRLQAVGDLTGLPHGLAWKNAQQPIASAQQRLPAQALGIG